MKLTLDVVASVRIRRKKPWSRLAWIGLEKESVFLLEDRRVSVLFIPSGRTKRRVPTLEPFLKDTRSLNYTNDGSTLFGMRSDGSVFTWSKDSDVLSEVTEKYPGSQSNRDAKWRPSLFADINARRILAVTISTGQPGVEIFLYDDCDRWYQIEPNLEASIRPGRELAVDAVFVDDPSRGAVVRCGFAYSLQDSVRFTVLVAMRFHAGISSSLVHQWSSVDVPLQRISSNAETRFQKGFYLVKWSHDGRLAAVVVNAADDDGNDGGRILFASVECAVLMSAAVPQDGGSPSSSSSSSSHRHSWIGDVQWTHDDLFLVAVRRSGSVCLLSRSGEVLTIATQGCSMDLSAAQSLAIHPRVSVVRNSMRIAADDDSSMTTNNILKQRFSVCCHPRQPKFFVSDGYMATCLQLPPLVCGPHRAVYFFLRNAHLNLRRLRRLSSRMESDLVNTDSIAKTNWPNVLRPAKLRVSWEVPVMSDDDCCDDDDNDDDESACKSDLAVHRVSAIGNASQGTLSFGALDGVSASPRRTDDPLGELVLDVEVDVVQSLMTAWSIVVGTNDVWTLEWEARAKDICHLLDKLCRVLSNEVTKAIAICERFLLIGRLDAASKNTLPVIVNAIKCVIRTLLRCVLQEHDKSIDEARLADLQAIVQFASSCGDMVVATYSYASDQTALNDQYSAVASCPRQDRDRHLSVTLRNRLGSVWRLLHRAISRLYLNSDDADNTNLVDSLSRIQSTIQRSGKQIGHSKGVVVTAEQQKYLLMPSDRDAIVAQWMRDIVAAFEDERTSGRRLRRQLHTILYAHLSAYNLKQATEFVLWLLSKISDGAERCGESSSKAAWMTLRTYARFMKSYFDGETLMIRPWHRPRLLGRCRDRSRTRLIRLDRLRVTSDVQAMDQGNWSPDVAVGLLLLTGCVREAAALASSLGDWKTSFVVKSVRLLANDDRKPAAVANLQQFYVRCLQKTIYGLGGLTDVNNVCDDRLSSTLADCFLVGSLCGLNCVSAILTKLLAETKQLLVKLDTVYVPNDIYLPRPPMYCPQLKEPTVDEDYLLARLSSISRLICVTLTASNCVVPVAKHYVQELLDIAGRTSMTASDLREWPLADHLTSLNDACIDDDNGAGDGFAELADLFRDYCSIAWFLHCRDKASRHFRRFRQLLDGLSTAATTSTKSKILSKMGMNVLHWLVRLIPFAECMDWQLDIYDCILSVLMDMPADDRATAVLARCFPDPKCVPDELEYRVARLITVWRRVGVKSGRNLSKNLSDVYLEQCTEIGNIMIELRRAVGSTLDEDVFVDAVDDDDDEEQMASRHVRPFEVDWEYYVFLKLLLDIAFLKNVSNKEAEVIKPIPLVPSSRPLQIKRHLLDIDLSTTGDTKLSAFQRMNWSWSAVDSEKTNAMSRMDEGTSTPLSAQTDTHRPSILETCRQVAAETTTSTSCESGNRHEGLHKLFVWLIAWTNKADCFEGLHAQGPRIKVRIAPIQLMQAARRSRQQPAVAARRDETDKCSLERPLSRVSAESPTIVTSADVLSSTPVAVPVVKVINVASSLSRSLLALQEDDEDEEPEVIQLQAKYIERLHHQEDMEKEEMEEKDIFSPPPSPPSKEEVYATLNTIHSEMDSNMSSKITSNMDSKEIMDTTSIANIIEVKSIKCPELPSKPTQNISTNDSATNESEPSRFENQKSMDDDSVVESSGQSIRMARKRLVRRKAIRKKSSHRVEHVVEPDGPTVGELPIRLLRLPLRRSDDHRKCKIFDFHSQGSQGTSTETKMHPPGYIPPLLTLRTSNRPNGRQLIPLEVLQNYEPKREVATNCTLLFTVPKSESNKESLLLIGDLPKNENLPKSTIAVATSDGVVKVDVCDAHTNTDDVLQLRRHNERNLMTSNVIRASERETIVVCNAETHMEYVCQRKFADVAVGTDDNN